VREQPPFPQAGHRPHMEVGGGGGGLTGPGWKGKVRTRQASQSSRCDSTLTQVAPASFRPNEGETKSAT